MSAVRFSLKDAWTARGLQLEEAEREFEKACQRAAAVAAQRKRHADKGWETARVQARKIAVLRARLWKEHTGRDSGRLRVDLMIHESRLADGYRPRITAAQRRDELWYSRMIRSELVRRGVLDVDAQQAERRRAAVEYGERKTQALVRFEAAS